MWHVGPDVNSCLGQPHGFLTARKGGPCSQFTSIFRWKWPEGHRSGHVTGQTLAQCLNSACSVGGAQYSPKGMETAMLRACFVLQKRNYSRVRFSGLPATQQTTILTFHSTQELLLPGGDDELSQLWEGRKSLPRDPESSPCLPATSSSVKKGQYTCPQSLFFCL